MTAFYNVRRIDVSTIDIRSKFESLEWERLTHVLNGQARYGHLVGDLALQMARFDQELVARYERVCKLHRDQQSMAELELEVVAAMAQLEDQFEETAREREKLADERNALAAERAALQRERDEVSALRAAVKAQRQSLRRMSWQPGTGLILGDDFVWGGAYANVLNTGAGLFIKEVSPEKDLTDELLAAAAEMRREDELAADKAAGETNRLSMIPGMTPEDIALVDLAMEMENPGLSAFIGRARVFVDGNTPLSEAIGNLREEPLPESELGASPFVLGNIAADREQLAQLLALLNNTHGLMVSVERSMAGIEAQVDDYLVGRQIEPTEEQVAAIARRIGLTVLDAEEASHTEAYAEYGREYTSGHEDVGKLTELLASFFFHQDPVVLREALKRLASQIGLEMKESEQEQGWCGTTVPGQPTYRLGRFTGDIRRRLAAEYGKGADFAALNTPSFWELFQHAVRMCMHGGLL